jgi:NADPH:quinone reductase-like Zn-dependent oxidoreductase
MRAALFKKYGSKDSIEIGDSELPEPGENDILIQVKATTVTAVDAIFRSGSNFFPRLATGLFSPKIRTLGTELSGVINSVGDSVIDLKVGDEVVADSGTNYGAHAEYVLLSDQDPVVKKPESISFEEAAAISYGSLTALSFLRDHGKIKKGDTVLIIGASGSVGSYAVQLAKYYGAEVTGVCSTKNVDLVKSLGADHVIDYKEESIRDISARFDIIFDTIGRYSIGETKHLLKDESIYLTTVLSLRSVFDMVRTGKAGKKSKLAFTGLRGNDEKKEDLDFIIELFKENRLRSVIDRAYKLDDIIAAFDYVEKGHKVGNVIIKV